MSDRTTDNETMTATLVVRGHRAVARRVLIWLALAALSAGVAAAAASSAGAASGGLAGSWRVYSARLYYDAGGGGSVAESLRPLTISGSRWHWGSSSGNVSVHPIAAADWRRWGLQPYGPKQKAVFTNWAGHPADGPIETSGGRIDFVWVIYRVAQPTVQARGTVYLKLGRPHP